VRLLIVEDEPAMAGILQFNFEQEGYEVAVAGDGFRAIELFEQAHAAPEDGKPAEAFDAVVLDLMLPGMSGYEICRRIRKLDPHVPVLVLSARTLAEDRMLAFDAGTDQYLTKPFELAELLNRVRNVIERHRTISAQESKPPAPEIAEKPGPECYLFPRFTLDLKRYELIVGETTYTLTSRELELLKYFIEHEDTVLSRAQILRDVWDEPPNITTRTIDNFVLKLRRYIEPDPANPQHILSLRGAGYRFIGSPSSEK
jgi:two-component system, OmpR family, alkaline phosphatase synthesis response regulator PhoP